MEKILATFFKKQKHNVCCKADSYLNTKYEWIFFFAYYLKNYFHTYSRDTNYFQHHISYI